MYVSFTVSFKLEYFLFFVTLRVKSVTLRPCSYNFFYGQGPRPLLWPGQEAERGKTTVSGILNCLHYSKIL